MPKYDPLQVSDPADLMYATMVILVPVMYMDNPAMIMGRVIDKLPSGSIVEEDDFRICDANGHTNEEHERELRRMRNF